MAPLGVMVRFELAPQPILNLALLSVVTARAGTTGIAHSLPWL
jgi:hypothetical protein